MVGLNHGTIGLPVFLTRNGNLIGLGMRILLTQGKEALLDEIDYAKHAIYLWRYSGYAIRKQNGKNIFLHVEIAKDMGIWIAGLEVDHKNLNKLDCRRQNLRVATQQQTTVNRETQRGSSGYIGVKWQMKSQQWQIRIISHNVTNPLGYSRCKHCAARIYNNAAINIFKEFAVLNIVEPCEHFIEESGS
jgi:hypothetical protein